MKNVFFKLVTTAAAASLVLAALPVSADEEAKEIKVAVAGGFYPITYADDNGEAQGYDVEVFKAVDELLPQYTFTYEITDKETMNVGVQSGTYQVSFLELPLFNPYLLSFLESVALLMPSTFPTSLAFFP